MNEKVYEFEQNKRNNLIFYGLNNEARETPEILIAKIQNIIRVTLGIRRDINLTKVRQDLNLYPSNFFQVARMYTGPEVSGSRPVLVTFETFKDREEVILNSFLTPFPGAEEREPVEGKQHPHQ